MFSLDPDCTDLCLIDSGIKSLDKVPLRQNLQSINLHSNYIQKVENLSHLCKLRHLDLSSNQISVIDGLDGLQSLRTINLSCNYLKDLRGLAGLRSLVKLSVSYNQINDISGLKSLHGPDYKLSQLELHGNQLSSWKHVLQCLIGCRNLRQLTLCWDGSSNPICDTRDYRAKLLSALTQLETLDNVNKQGVLVSGTQVIADIPDRTDDSEDSTASRGKSPGRRKRRSRIPGYRKSTASSRARKEASTPPPETSRYFDTFSYVVFHKYSKNTYANLPAFCLERNML
ncbi:hypothetical protein FSP39_008999 [Pinctada imbricata]|uniref:Leucine-rich repeat and coiled-coil domain-containing protein 1 n=1 Tax=Pinctada imbricata TaxID=66713 RepID=A0AA89BKG7_PINIB|nr:hypothetical protein FSP39_008999 [Pinctada imbricata]